MRFCPFSATANRNEITNIDRMVTLRTKFSGGLHMPECAAPSSAFGTFSPCKKRRGRRLLKGSFRHFRSGASGDALAMRERVGLLPAGEGGRRPDEGPTCLHADGQLTVSSWQLAVAARSSANCELPTANCQATSHLLSFA